MGQEGDCMHNAFIWSFDEDFIYPAILKLADENIIDIKYWLGFKVNCPYCTHEIHDVWEGKLDDNFFQGYDTQAYDYVYEYLPQFIDQYSRHYMPNQKSFQEYVNVFNIFFDYYYNYIIKHKINLFMFIDVPHDGVDLIVYYIAKYLKLKIIIISPSLFANRFFCISDINDYGTFNTSSVQIEPITIQVENKFLKDLFYMQKQKKQRKLKIQKRLWKFKRIIKKNLIKWLTYQLQKYYCKKKYKESVKKYSVKQIDLNRTFVYFPLHLQPEMTTSAIGSKYVDQVLAIEHLRMIIPPDWYIYVKENPK